MTTALQGCESRSQLEVAHSILLKRLLVAQQTIIKYEAQYQQLEAPLSPISTVPELHEEFDRIGNVDDHMRFMLQKFPHHQEQLNAEALSAVAQGQSWTTIYPTQPLPMQERLPPTPSINFQSSRANISIGKKKVDWDDTAPWDDKASSLEEGTELSFGFQTPFCTNTKFFDTSASTPATTYFSTPSAPTAPNPNSMQDVIVGLATPSQTNFGDNVRDHSMAAGQASNAMILSRRNVSKNTQTPSSFDPPQNTIKPQANDLFNAGGGRPQHGNGGPPGEGGNSGGGGGSGGPGGGGHFPPPPNNNHPSGGPSSGASGGHQPPGGGEAALEGKEAGEESLLTLETNLALLRPMVTCLPL